MNEQDKRDLAITMAQKSTSRFRLGAVLTRRRKLISIGYNHMTKTHPLQHKFHDKDFTIGIHAEIDCCIGISAGDLKGAEVCVVRLLRNGRIAMAKPCTVCRKLLRWVGIKEVVYSTGIGPWERLAL